MLTRKDLARAVLLVAACALLAFALPTHAQTAWLAPAGGQVPQAAQQHRALLVRTAHAAWGLDAPVAVFAAQVHQESAWRPDAMSHVGAQGLAQFMPATAQWISRINPTLAGQQPYNPAWSLRALVTYDRWLYDRAPTRYTPRERMWVALRSYNGGLGHWQAEAAATGAAQPTRAQVDAACGKARRAAVHCTENLGYLERSALFRQLVWTYLFKNYSVGDLAEFLEIYGIPVRIGKYPASASEKEKATLLRALAAVGHNAAGNRYLQVERDTVNATASQRALSIEMLRIQIDLEKQLEAIRTNEGFTQADREEQRAKALSVAAQARANATARAELDHVRDLREELKRVTEQYEQGLTNAAMQGGKSLREYIQGMLRATAFRIVLDPIMKPLAGLLAGVTGGSSAAASQGGGLMGTANLLSSAYSALTTGVSSSITAGFAKLAGSSFGQSIGLSNSSAIMGNNPSAFVPAGGQLTPLGQSIGTGLGMLGSGLAGYGISSAISNGYTTGGNTVNVLSGIASAFLGPIAGVVGGLINRAFGRKLKDTGIEGTIGGTAGFEGNSYQFYKGGWFRSDKTVRGELDAGVDKSLDTAVKQMQLSMAGLAMSIGAPTEAISGFSQAIKLSFNGLDEAGIQEKITQTLADYNEALASAFIASVDRSEVPKWVDRLLGNVDASAVERLRAVSEWPAKLLQSIGTSRDQLAQLYAEGLASGDAAKAGQAVADSLVASIEASMLGNASAQVSAAVRTVQAESTAINFSRLQNARSVLESARGAADLSKVAGLETAIGVVGKDTTEFYATFEEWAFAQGVTNGTLRDLDSKAQAQLTTAEAIVQALGAQNDVAKTLADAEIAAAEERFRIEAGILDDTLNNAKQQLNALLGIDEGVLSMEAALGQFGAATSALAQQAAAAAAAAATAASTASSTAASAMKDALSGLGAAISSAIGTTGAGAGAGAAGKPSAKPESSAPSGLPPGTPWGVAQSPDAILGASKYTDADLRAMGFNPADLLAYTQLSQQSGVQGGLDSVVDDILRRGDDALWSTYGLQHLPTSRGPNGEVYTTLTDKTGKTYSDMKAWTDSFTNAQRAAASEAWTNSVAGNGINSQELQTILQIGSTADRQLYWAGGSLDMGGFAAQDGKHYSSATIVSAINTALSQGASVQDVLSGGQANFGLNAEDIRTAARAAGIPGFAVGINRVPHDMLALIHEDEAVLPARFNPFNPNAPRLGGNDSTAEQLQELRHTVEQLVALMAANNDYTRRHADQFDKVTAGGNAMAMEAL